MLLLSFFPSPWYLWAVKTMEGENSNFFFYKYKHGDLHFIGLITLWALKASICLSNLDCVSLELWGHILRHILYVWYSAKPISVKQIINLHNDSLLRWSCSYWKAPWHPREVCFEKMCVCGAGEGITTIH